MSSVNKNLSLSISEVPRIENAKIAIITADWNQEITYSMRDASIDELIKFGVEKSDILNITVPGAFELPSAAKMLLTNGKWDGIICIGCVIKGETKHDEYISNAVAQGIMNLSIVSGKPIIFGVLTPNDMQQALDRAGGQHGNKGVEAAHTLIKMINLAKEIKNAEKKSIGF